MKPTLKLVALLPLAALFGCNSTSIETSHTAPGAKPLEFHKVLVVAIAHSEGLRRSAEDTIAAQIAPAEPLVSYKLFSDETELKNREVVAEKLRQNGVDGIITMRPLYNKQEISTMPSSAPYPYHSFYGYYGYGWGSAPWGSEIVVDDVVGIETNIYNAADSQLIWSGITKSVNAGSINSLIVDVSKTVRSQLEKQGLVKPKK